MGQWASPSSWSRHLQGAEHGLRATPLPAGLTDQGVLGTQAEGHRSQPSGWGMGRQMLHWGPERKQVFISINSLKSVSTSSLSTEHLSPLGSCWWALGCVHRNIVHNMVTWHCSCLSDGQGLLTHRGHERCSMNTFWTEEVGNTVYYLTTFGGCSIVSFKYFTTETLKTNSKLSIARLRIHVEQPKEQRSRLRLHGANLMAFQLKAHVDLATFLAERGVGAGFGEATVKG